MMAGTNRFLYSLAGALTAGAGVLHVAAAAGHRGDDVVMVLFALTAVTQLAVAGVLAARPHRGTLAATAAVNGGAAAAWLASRLTGLPFVDGLREPQAVGVQDLTAASVEAAAVAVAVVAAGRRRPVPARGLSPVWALAAVPVVIGLAAPHSHSPAAHARGDDHAHGGDRARAAPLASDPIFRGADTSRASQAQLRTARDLIVRTREAVTRQFPDEASVMAAGYRSIGDGRFFGSFEHFVRASYLIDGRELDPEHIESIVMERTPSGKRVVSGMFVLELGKTLADAPDVAGDLTAWHDHQDLCWDVTGMRLAGRLVNGRCVPAGLFLPTPPMLHVWLEDHPCGHFAGIEGHGTACARPHGH